MEKRIKFGFLILVGLLVINTCSTCTTSRKVNETTKYIVERQDSLYKATIDSLTKIIKIEGLKSELRMIQSTDRKPIDVNRGKEIMEELKKTGF